MPGQDARQRTGEGTLSEITAGVQPSTDRGRRQARQGTASTEHHDPSRVASAVSRRKHSTEEGPG